MSSILIVCIIIFTVTLFVSGWILTSWMQHIRTITHRNKKLEKQYTLNMLNEIITLKKEHKSFVQEKINPLEVDYVEVLDESGTEVIYLSEHRKKRED